MNVDVQRVLEKAGQTIANLTMQNLVLTTQVEQLTEQLNAAQEPQAGE